jgi:hypothetical protein
LPCKGDLFRFTLSLTSTSRLIAGEKGEDLFLHEQVIVFDADRPVRGETIFKGRRRRCRPALYGRRRRAFLGFEPLVCTNDAEAIDQVKCLGVGHAIELWCGEPLVIRLEAKAK